MICAGASARALLPFLRMPCQKPERAGQLIRFRDGLFQGGDGRRRDQRGGRLGSITGKRKVGPDGLKRLGTNAADTIEISEILKGNALSIAVQFAIRHDGAGEFFTELRNAGQRGPIGGVGIQGLFQGRNGTFLPLRSIETNGTADRLKDQKPQKEGQEEGQGAAVNGGPTPASLTGR